jgi:hypothetical protein
VKDIDNLAEDLLAMMLGDGEMAGADMGLSLQYLVHIC